MMNGTQVNPTSWPAESRAIIHQSMWSTPLTLLVTVGTKSRSRDSSQGIDLVPVDQVPSHTTPNDPAVAKNA